MPGIEKCLLHFVIVDGALSTIPLPLLVHFVIVDGALSTIPLPLLVLV
jgi:hypothetical protein